MTFQFQQKRWQRYLCRSSHGLEFTTYGNVIVYQGDFAGGLLLIIDASTNYEDSIEIVYIEGSRVRRHELVSPSRSETEDRCRVEQIAPHRLRVRYFKNLPLEIVARRRSFALILDGSVWQKADHQLSRVLRFLLPVF